MKKALFDFSTMVADVRAFLLEDGYTFSPDASFRQRKMAIVDGTLVFLTACVDPGLFLPVVLLFAFIVAA